MKKVLILAGIVLAPSLALAQNLDNLQNLVSAFGGIVSQLIPIVFGIAVIVFFWGLAKYILAAGSEESKAEGRRIMIGGIIAIFVMASIWGIVRWAQSALGVGQVNSIPVPSVQGL